MVTTNFVVNVTPSTTPSSDINYKSSDHYYLKVVSIVAEQFTTIFTVSDSGNNTD